MCHGPSSAVGPSPTAFCPEGQDIATIHQINQTAPKKWQLAWHLLDPAIAGRGLRLTVNRTLTLVGILLIGSNPSGFGNNQVAKIGNGLGRFGASPQHTGAAGLVLPPNLRHAAPLLAQFDAYWQALAAQYGAPPFRQHIDPRALQNGLENALMVEEMAPGHARLRVAGQVFDKLLGSDPRGMPLSAFFLPAARANLQALLGQVFATPAGARLLVSKPAAFFGQANNGILQLWPLRDDTGAVTRALGCLVLARAPAQSRAPQRLSIAHHSLQPLACPAPPTAPQGPAQKKDAPRKGAAHLVVVKGGGGPAV